MQDERLIRLVQQCQKLKDSMVTCEPDVTMEKPLLDVEQPQLDMKQPLSDAVSSVDPLSDLRIPLQTSKLEKISHCLLMKTNNKNVGASQSGQQVGNVSKTPTPKNEYVLPDHVSCFGFIDCHVGWFFIGVGCSFLKVVILCIPANF